MADGGATICLLPGLDGTGLLYRRLRAELQRDFETLVLAYGVADCDYVGLAEKLTPLLPQGKPFVLIAESFAGPLAILLAARRPAGLQAIVLAASFARAPINGARATAALMEHLPA